VVSVEQRTQQHILQLIVQQDDVSWKQIIFGLIETQQMDPWDIDISMLAHAFLEQLKKLKEMDFRVSGKVVLASAVLLKLKAERLRDEEVAALERLITQADEPFDLGLDEPPFEDLEYAQREKPELIPRTPQPRKRKVSVFDLVEALEKALEQDARRPVKAAPRVLDTIDPPDHHIDISAIIRDVYDKIYGHYEQADATQLAFHHIVRSTDPRDMVMTFIPLLHLENARKVEMRQPEHFGEIAIHLLDQTPPAVPSGTQMKLDYSEKAEAKTSKKTKAKERSRQAALVEEVSTSAVAAKRKKKINPLQPAKPF
jgi:segregation and condensation protein A